MCMSEDIPVISMKDFQQVDMNEKLDLLMSAINKINTNFHIKLEEINTKISDEHQGLTPRLHDAEVCITELQTRMDNLEEANAQLKDEVMIPKGLVQVNDNKVGNLDKKVIDLTARSMANNVVITGINGDTEEEDCKEKVLTLFRSEMKMQVKDSEIEVAHRAKGKRGSKPRAMIVRCQYALCDRLSYLFSEFHQELKDAKNSDGDPYFVSKQLPEPLYTQKKERDENQRSEKEKRRNPR